MYLDIHMYGFFFIYFGPSGWAWLGLAGLSELAQFYFYLFSRLILFKILFPILLYKSS